MKEKIKVILSRYLPCHCDEDSSSRERSECPQHGLDNSDEAGRFDNMVDDLEGLMLASQEDAINKCMAAVKELEKNSHKAFQLPFDPDSVVSKLEEIRDNL